MTKSYRRLAESFSTRCLTSVRGSGANSNFDTCHNSIFFYGFISRLNELPEDFWLRLGALHFGPGELYQTGHFRAEFTIYMTGVKSSNTFYVQLFFLNSSM